MKLNWIERWALGQIVGSDHKQAIIQALEDGEYAVVGSIFADWFRKRGK